LFALVADPFETKHAFWNLTKAPFLIFYFRKIENDDPICDRVVLGNMTARMCEFPNNHTQKFHHAGIVKFNSTTAESNKAIFIVQSIFIFQQNIMLPL